jgi:hypothetical protein
VGGCLGVGGGGVGGRGGGCEISKYFTVTLINRTLVRTLEQHEVILSEIGSKTLFELL